MDPIWTQFLHPQKYKYLIEGGQRPVTTAPHFCYAPPAGNHSEQTTNRDNRAGKGVKGFCGLAVKGVLGPQIEPTLQL